MPRRPTKKAGGRGKATSDLRLPSERTAGVKGGFASAEHGSATAEPAISSLPVTKQLDKNSTKLYAG
jgi:hypothetical protein